MKRFTRPIGVVLGTAAVLGAIAVGAAYGVPGANGQLNSVQCVSQPVGSCGRRVGLDEPTSVAMSTDELHVFAASATSSSLSIFDRNTGNSGKLTQRNGNQCISEAGAGGCENGRALDGATDVANVDNSTWATRQRGRRPDQGRLGHLGLAPAELDQQLRQQRRLRQLLRRQGTCGRLVGRHPPGLGQRVRRRPRVDRRLQPRQAEQRRLPHPAPGPGRLRERRRLRRLCERVRPRYGARPQDQLRREDALRCGLGAGERRSAGVLDQPVQRCPHAAPAASPDASAKTAPAASRHRPGAPEAGGHFDRPRQRRRPQRLRRLERKRRGCRVLRNKTQTR